ncbi:hypothetical protein CRE_03752 [Caenorhabditis remanei]|uniref:Uncharacterized protein n=2 Tax=Caenorhabditis remanei TaxID=31234 RepID=E3LY30_CAERE|nr:hypothetical protein CRE_03752 [Caenorhabditis remanei]
MTLTWSNFPKKELILHFLDYEARCNLRTCSKNDLALVDSIHYVPSRMKISEISSRMDPEKSHIRLDIESFTIWFIGKHDKTRIERAWNEELSEMAETKAENRFDLFQRYVDRFLNNGTLEADILLIKHVPIEPLDHWKIKVSSFILLSPGTPADYVINWLTKIDSQLKELMVCNWTLEGVSEVPAVLEVSERLHLSEAADLTDEHLERLTATGITISSLEITLNGIKKALENHLKNGRRDDELIFCSNFPEDFDPVELFPNGLKFQKIEGTFPEDNIYKILGGFENKHGVQDTRICRCSNTLFQVSLEPKKSKDHVHILWPFTF